MAHGLAYIKEMPTEKDPRSDSLETPDMQYVARCVGRRVYNVHLRTRQLDSRNASAAPHHVHVAARELLPRDIFMPMIS